MVKIVFFGEFETVPQIITDIIDENIPALEEHLSQGWNIDELLKLGEHTSLSPINCALVMNRLKSLKWLVEHGVNLNVPYDSSFLYAVRFCNEKVIRYIVSHGAKVNGVNHVYSEAFMQALCGKKYENLPVIQSLGHTVKQYGSYAFRSAVSDGNYEVMDFFLKNGVDINCNYPDMVFPNKPTPLCVAARHGDFPMCRYLVEHGADVTLTDEDGMRPYSIALENGYTELAEYFKSLEPAEYHSLQNKLDELKPYKLSEALFDFLQGSELHYELDGCGFVYIEFFSLMDTVPMKVGRKKLLRISKTTGDYNNVSIVWHPKTKQIAYYDMEHEVLKDICGFEDFMADLSAHMQKIIDEM